MFSFDLNGSLPLKMIAFVVFSIGIVGVAPVAATLLEAFQRRCSPSAVRCGAGALVSLPLPLSRPSLLPLAAEARSWLSASHR